MALHPELDTFSLAGLAHRCARETELFFKRLANDPRYCHELIRRAVVGRNSGAWELVFHQYRPLVASWIERHPAFPSGQEEVQYFMNRAFERMWLAMSPEKFQRFPDLKSLLRYLQMCVNSVLLDHVRKATLPIADVEWEVAAASVEPEEPSAADQALDQVARASFWEQIRIRLTDEKEEMVVQGSFVLALKPSEICDHFRGTFADVREVYRIKENVLARLRRDTELRTFLEENA